MYQYAAMKGRMEGLYIYIYIYIYIHTYTYNQVRLVSVMGGRRRDTVTAGQAWFLLPSHPITATQIEQVVSTTKFSSFKVKQVC